MDILKALEGRRTYIIASLLAVLVFAQHMNWITKDLYDQLYVLLTGAGLATLRAALGSK